MTKLRPRSLGLLAQRAFDVVRHRLAGDSQQAGFTLIETVVAMSLFGMTLLPASSVIFGGMKAADVSNAQSDAVSIAASTLAQVQALPYPLVGFYSTEAGYVATCPSTVSACSGEPTVLLGSSTPASAFTPIGIPQTVGAVSFSVTTYITWASANVPSGTCSSGSTVCSGAYKLVTAVVSWGGNGRPKGSVTESTIVYPGGQGLWTGPGQSGTSSSTCPTTPSKPTGVSAAPYSDSSVSPDPGQSEIQVSWTPVALTSEPCYYVIDSAVSDDALPTSCSSAGTVQGNPWQPGQAASYVVTGLNSGTKYFFDVIAYNADGSQCAISDPTSATTLSATVAPSCSVTSFTVTAVPSQSTAKTYETSAGNMTDNLSLVASTTGSCSSISVQAHLVNSSTQDPGSPYTLVAGSSGQFAYTVPSQNVAWTTGQHVFTVYVGSTATAEQQSIEVCAHAGQGQKTTSPTACP